MARQKSLAGSWTWWLMLIICTRAKPRESARQKRFFAGRLRESSSSIIAGASRARELKKFLSCTWNLFSLTHIKGQHIIVIRYFFTKISFRTSNLNFSSHSLSFLAEKLFLLASDCLRFMFLVAIAPPPGRHHHPHDDELIRKLFFGWQFARNWSERALDSVWRSEQLWKCFDALLRPVQRLCRAWNYPSDLREEANELDFYRQIQFTI